MTALDTAAPHRSKTLAGALALIAGSVGAHRLYLGARWWWIYPLLSMPAMAIALRAEPWYRHPASSWLRASRWWQCSRRSSSA